MAAASAASLRWGFSTTLNAAIKNAAGVVFAPRAQSSRSVAVGAALALGASAVMPIAMAPDMGQASKINRFERARIAPEICAYLDSCNCMPRAVWHCKKDPCAF